MHNSRNGYITVLAALALAACAGDKGADGTQGAQGQPGQPGQAGQDGTNGQNGVSTGSISGAVSYNPGAAVLPASAITVETLPASTTTTTAADGTFTLSDVPVGIYSLKFSCKPAPAVPPCAGFAALSPTTTVSVLAGKTMTFPAQTMVATNPLVVTTAVAIAAAGKTPAPVGFGKQGQVDVDVAGGSGNYTYAWAPLATCSATKVSSCNPTAVTLSSATAKSPTFTTGALPEIAASSGMKVAGFSLPTRLQVVPVSAVHVTQATYSFTVTVTDTTTKFQKSATVAIPAAALAGSQTTVPTNNIVIVSIPGNTGATLKGPDGSDATAQLNDAATAYPWFKASTTGTYVVTGSGTTGSLTVVTSNFSGSSFGNASFSESASCTGCHTGIDTAQGSTTQFAKTANAKFKAWSNSAHGNHFFKYMVDTAPADAFPALDYKGSSDPIWAGNYGKLPTANYGVFWDMADVGKAPMTTFEFGMTGAEGSHYSASCTGCHTVGFNQAVDSGGMDELLRFPNLASVFTLTGPTTTPTGAAADQVTAKPDFTFWTGAQALPASVKRFAGMQCESCHGPLGQHMAGLGPAPRGEYDVAACAICHDRATVSATQIGGSHDRVKLWRNSKHSGLFNKDNAGNPAPLELAQGEGTRSPCQDCHSAQGFAARAILNEGNAVIDMATDSTGTAIATANDVQPQTCAACHDAHSTEVRITGEQPVALKAGFTVAGAGTGALCMACHNSRRAYLHNDATAFTGNATPHENGAANQADVLMGVNAFFVDPNRNYASKHALVEDTCVGCHMKLHAAKLNGQTLAPGTTNHTMEVDGSICSACHGAGITLDGVESAFNGARAAALAQLATTLKSAVATGFTVGTTTFPKTDVASVDLSGSSIVFKRADGTTIASGSATSIKNDGGLALAVAQAGTVAGRKDVLVRAIWNLTFINDNSGGVHNPTFAFDVLAATKAALAQDVQTAACAAACL